MIRGLAQRGTDAIDLGTPRYGKMDCASIWQWSAVHGMKQAERATGQRRSWPTAL